MMWRDKSDVCILTDTHNSQTNSNFCDEHGNTIKPLIVQDYNQHIGYADKEGKMMNSYTIEHRPRKWTE
jgi:hypothetical protein